MSDSDGEEDPACSHLLCEPVRETILDDPLQPVASPLDPEGIECRPPFCLEPLQGVHDIGVVPRDRWTLLHALHPAHERSVLRGIERIRPSRAESADIYPAPAPINALLRGIYRIETAIAASVGLPFGLSLACIAARR